MKSIEERIAERMRKRAKFTGTSQGALLLIGETLDDYLEHRIEADKTLEGILKDIQGDLASVAEQRVTL